MKTKKIKLNYKESQILIDALYKINCGVLNNLETLYAIKEPSELTEIETCMAERKQQDCVQLMEKLENLWRL